MTPQARVSGSGGRCGKPPTTSGTVTVRPNSVPHGPTRTPGSGASASGPQQQRLSVARPAADRAARPSCQSDSRPESDSEAAAAAAAAPLRCRSAVTVSVRRCVPPPQLEGPESCGHARAGPGPGHRVTAARAVSPGHGGHWLGPRPV
jgi:hypothetical protein